MCHQKQKETKSVSFKFSMHGSLKIQVNNAGDEEKTLDQLVGDDELMTTVDRAVESTGCRVATKVGSFQVGTVAHHLN
jgi:hypothetical protein